MAVSFTISLELVILVVRALGSALRDLRLATERVRAGDYSARVPVVATDETGKLAQSFNTMVEGLDERERLRDAFGALERWPDHADRAVAAAVEITGLMHRRYRGEFSAGIGVNSGVRPAMTSSSPTPPAR